MSFGWWVYYYYYYYDYYHHFILIVNITTIILCITVLVSFLNYYHYDFSLDLHLFTLWGSMSILYVNESIDLQSNSKELFSNEAYIWGKLITGKLNYRKAFLLLLLLGVSLEELEFVLLDFYEKNKLFMMDW